MGQCQGNTYPASGKAINEKNKHVIAERDYQVPYERDWDPNSGQGQFMKKEEEKDDQYR